MKYKVGDKLKVKDPEECGTYQTVGGEYIVITKVDGDYNYDIYCRGERVGMCHACLKDSNLEPLEPSWDNLQVGDIVVDEGGDERRVLAVTGEIFAHSYAKDHSIYCDWRSIHAVKKIGWKVKGSEDVEEISMDEVAKKFGKSVDKIRIKKED